MKIGFVIGRIGGIDGVALETEKWIAVLERMGHQVRVLTGELEAEIANATLLPELAFSHPATVAEQEIAFFGRPAVEAEFMAELTRRALHIQAGIISWIEDQGVELLVAENASALPCHLALGMGLRAVYDRTGMPVITHDHDFAWERRGRYDTPYIGVREHIARCFPVKLPNVRHAVINSAAQQALASRFGIHGTAVVPNVMDFDRPHGVPDEYNATLLGDLGITEDEIPLFQITRIVGRKGIGTAIDLVHRLQDPRVKLVITGTSTDDTEGHTAKLRQQVARLGLGERVLFAGQHFDAYRAVGPGGQRIYSIEDAYARAQGCTYFSTYEGFGNAFVEAVVARRPIFVNNYEPVYWPDIGAKGFHTVQIDHAVLTDEAVEAVRQVITDPDRARAMTEKNFALGKEHFSYQALERILAGLLRA